MPIWCSKHCKKRFHRYRFRFCWAEKTNAFLCWFREKYLSLAAIHSLALCTIFRSLKMQRWPGEYGIEMLPSKITLLNFQVALFKTSKYTNQCNASRTTTTAAKNDSSPILDGSFFGDNHKKCSGLVSSHDWIGYGCFSPYSTRLLSYTQLLCNYVTTTDYKHFGGGCYDYYSFSGRTH